MSEKNRQHYVPQFYLRNFSENKKAIRTFNISNSKYIEYASIKDMCQKHNFYGADKKVEDFLNVEIETKASAIIKNILDSNIIPNQIDEEYVHLAMFLLVSEARNLKIAESNNNMADFMAKTLIKNDPEFKDIDLDKFKLELKEPANMAIQIAIENTAVILDLTPILIVEQTGARRFITSDNPLIRYNSFYLSKNYPGGFGYINRGLQLFLPISPHKCILFYDSLAYDIPELKNGVLTLKNARDVDHLNELFYLNAYNNVFFNQKTKIDFIERIHNKNKRVSKISELKREVSSFTSDDSDDSRSELIQFSLNRVAKKINFSWISNSEYANNLIIPSHMGGINRTEWPPIRELLRRKSDEYAKDRPPFREKLFRKDR